MVKKKKMVIEYKYAQGAIGGFSAGVVYKPKSQKELPLRISGKKISCHWDSEHNGKAETEVIDTAEWVWISFVSVGPVILACKKGVQTKEYYR